MKWSEMSSEQRDTLVHEKVMGNPDIPCTGRFVAADYVGSGRLLCITCGAKYVYPWAMQHNPLPPPHYSESMDAAWLILQHMVTRYSVEPASNEVWDRFCEANFEGYGSSSNIYRWVASWTAERLCLAALHALGVEIE